MENEISWAGQSTWHCPLFWSALCFWIWMLLPELEPIQDVFAPCLDFCLFFLDKDVSQIHPWLKILEAKDFKEGGLIIFWTPPWNLWTLWLKIACGVFFSTDENIFKHAREDEPTVPLIKDAQKSCSWWKASSYVLINAYTSSLLQFFDQWIIVHGWWHCCYENPSLSHLFNSFSAFAPFRIWQIYSWSRV